MTKTPRQLQRQRQKYNKRNGGGWHEGAEQPRPPAPPDPLRFTSGCTDPDFPEWWQQFGMKLSGQLNDEMLALAAFTVGRSKAKAAIEAVRAQEPKA